MANPLTRMFADRKGLFVTITRASPLGLEDNQRDKTFHAKLHNFSHGLMVTRIEEVTMLQDLSDPSTHVYVLRAVGTGYASMAGTLLS